MEDKQNLCLYCFEPSDTQICPHCGGDASAAVPINQLSPGTMLAGRILVGRAVGQDASGIVYAAMDTRHGVVVRVREFLPRDIAVRNPDGSVSPAPGSEERFQAGLSKMKRSAQPDENGERKYIFFMDNGTGYLIQRRKPTASEEPDEKPALSPMVKWIGIGASAVVVIVLIVLIARMLSGGSDVTDPGAQFTPGPSATASTWQPSLDGLTDPNQPATPSPTGDGLAVSTVNPDWQGEEGASDIILQNTPTPYVNWGDQGWNQYYPTATPYNGPWWGGYPTPTPRPENQVISSHSSRAEITAFQWQLIELGWLDYTSPSGVYDSATTQAVRDFQSYMNATYDITPLAVDGIAGPQTLYWLDQYNLSRKPAPTATPWPTRPPITPPPAVATPTPAPTMPDTLGTPYAPPTDSPGEDYTIDQDSDPLEITNLQVRLRELGWLEMETATGVYDAATTAAVYEFQRYVNEINNSQILPETGIADASTLDWLLNDITRPATSTPEPTQAPVPTETPAPVETAVPTEAPTPVPTEAPAPSPTQQVIDQNAESTVIEGMQQYLRDTLGYLTDGTYTPGTYDDATMNAVIAFQMRVNEVDGYERLTVSGICDYATYEAMTAEGYEKYLNPNPVQPTQTPAGAQPTEAPTPAPGIGPDSDAGTIAQMQEYLRSNLGYLADGTYTSGTYDDATMNAVIAFQMRVNEVDGYERLTVSGVCDQATIEAMRGEGWERYAMPQPTQPPAEPQPTEEPVVVIGPDSPQADILNMQSYLEQLGWLYPNTYTAGTYDNVTKDAVAMFQNYVNGLMGSPVLPTDGLCDTATQDYLLSGQYPYPAPQPTEAPAEPQPTEPGNPTWVDVNSSPDDILNLQSALYANGWLKDAEGAPAGSAMTGAFDLSTLRAVLNFQIAYNEQYAPLYGTAPLTLLFDEAAYGMTLEDAVNLNGYTLDMFIIDEATLNALSQAGSAVVPPME